MIDAILLIVAQLLAGWLIADFLSGVAHWLEDRVLTETTPFLGRLVVIANRRHHLDPVAFLAGSVWVRHGTTWATAGTVSVIWLALLGPSWIWASATAGGMLTAAVHYRTHAAPPAGSWCRALQDIGIIQSVRQHAQHHRPPSDGRYCALTDWLNPLLDRVHLWARLERLFRI